jgi:hypothetical protein
MARRPEEFGTTLGSWGEGKPVLVMLVARETGIGAKAMHYVLAALRSGEGLEGLGEAPRVEEWVRLYKKSKQIQDKWVDAMRPAPAGEIRASVICRGVQALAARAGRMSRDERAEWIRGELSRLSEAEFKEAVRDGAELVKKVVAVQEEDIGAAVEGKEPPDRFDESILRQPEAQFFIRVWMPCVVLYGDYPPRVLRRARRGDLGAICDLIRLDKAVVYERGIAQQIHKAYVGNRARHDSISRAFRQSIPRMSLKSVKARLAGALSHLTDAIDNRLSSAEIQSLFDAIERSLSKGRHQVDSDLPGGESLKKMVQRERRKFHLVTRKGGQK